MLPELNTDTGFWVAVGVAVALVLVFVIDEGTRLFWNWLTGKES